MRLGLDMLENSFLEGFWNDFWAWVWKCLKNSSLEAFWNDFWVWAWMLPERLLERLFGLGLEMLKNSSLPSGATFGPGPGNA